MLIDITLRITPQMLKDSQNIDNKALVGHLGTHFDVMDKEFPLDYSKRRGIVFDVSKVDNRDIGVSDINLDDVQKDMFVAFYSGYIEKEPYGTKTYFSEHPQLTNELVDALCDKGVSVIALDFAGIRRGKEHIPKDYECAQKNVFVVENLCNLKTLLDNGGRFTAHTYPMNYAGITGLPCRVIAEI